MDAAMLIAKSGMLYMGEYLADLPCDTYNIIFKEKYPFSAEKEQKALCFLQKAIMERMPIPCSFSFDSGIPSCEKTMSSLLGLEISNISFGL